MFKREIFELQNLHLKEFLLLLSLSNHGLYFSPSSHDSLTRAALKIREKSQRQKIAVAMSEFDSKPDDNLWKCFLQILVLNTWNQSTDIQMIFILKLTGYKKEL